MDMTGIPWPTKGDDPFTDTGPDPLSPTWTSLDWFDNLHFGDSALADAFKRGADKIISELRQGEDHRHPDPLFLPIVYLYRHAIELKLKAIIRIGLELELAPASKRTQDALHRHNLARLWTIAQRMMTAFSPDEDHEPLVGATGIIEALHRIDRSGQGLRYTADRDGESTLKRLPKSADLGRVRVTIEGLFNLLDGCECAFSEARDHYCEMLQDMADGPW